MAALGISLFLVPVTAHNEKAVSMIPQIWIQPQALVWVPAIQK